MPTITRYPTKPIECWNMMKDLRRAHFRHTWEAHSKGDVVILGIFEWFLCLFSGLGDFANPSYGPYHTVFMRNQAELIKNLEYTEQLGFTHDVCSAMRSHLGQIYRGLTTRSPLGDTVIPDFVFQPSLCHSVVKTGQLASEHLGIPYFDLEFSYKSTPQTKKYLIAQMQEAIEWMEQVTGRKYDDEKFIAALNNEWESMVLWARICEFQKAVPAPMDIRMMRSLRLPGVTLRHKKEAVIYFRTLYDEVQQRVKDGISAKGIETARLTYEGGTTHYNPSFFLRQPEKYGAVIVASQGAFTTMGVWQVHHEDGTWTAARTPKERGIEIRNREQGLESLAELYLDYYPILRWAGQGSHPQEFVKRVRDYSAVGAVFGLDRGCRALSAGEEEAKLAVQRAGIPVTMYEVCMCDPRDTDQQRIQDQMDAFFESLGLLKLELKPEKGPAEEVE